jgi:myosin heavy subunit
MLIIIIFNNDKIFYQLSKGASPELREKYSIMSPQYYHYISDAGCIDVEVSSIQ